MAGAIALGLARWLEKLCCVLRCAFIVASVVTRSMHPTVFIFCTVLHDVYIYLLRSTRSFPGLAMTLAWAGGIFIRYCKEVTCITLVDWCWTFYLYIVYHGSSKKVLTALLTLADCVGSLNKSQQNYIDLPMFLWRKPSSCSSQQNILNMNLSRTWELHLH